MVWGVEVGGGGVGVGAPESVLLESKLGEPDSYTGQDGGADVGWVDWPPEWPHELRLPWPRLGVSRPCGCRWGSACFVLFGLGLE